MNAQLWTAQEVREGKVTPNPHGGKLQAFYVDFLGADGNQQADTYWRRKEGNIPQKGEAYFGTIKEGQEGRGPRFYPERQEGPVSGGSKGHGATTSKSPDQQAAIQRQHSQQCAVEYAAVMQAQGRLKADFGPNDLRTLIDWFNADISRGLPA